MRISVSFNLPEKYLTEIGDENENSENMKIISFITILQKNLKLLKSSSPYDRLILLKVRNVRNSDAYLQLVVAVD